RLRDVRDVEVVGQRDELPALGYQQHRAGDVGQHGEGGGGDDGGSDGEPVEAVREVDGVGGADHHDPREQQVGPAEIELEDVGGHEREGEVRIHQQLHAAVEAGVEREDRAEEDHRLRNDLVATGEPLGVL